MNRCDYCEFRNSWGCTDEADRVSNDTFCDDFKMDFNTLSEKKKKTIQKILMKESENNYDK